MTNSVNSFGILPDRARQAFDQLAGKSKQRNASDAGESETAETAGKTKAEQLKDIFERGGMGDLYNRARGYSRPNPFAADYAPAAADAGGIAGALLPNDANSPLSGGLDKMLKNLGFDPAALGSANAASLQYARVQYELNISVMQTMMNGDGQTSQAINFSFKLDYEWLNIGKGQNAASNPLDLQSGDDADAIMKKLMEYFNPENTAGRILDFALGFFPNSQWAKSGNTLENRQGFSDYIGAAIQKGFDQAMGILGKVDDKTQAGIDTTHGLVFQGLEDFVKNGLTAQEKERALGVEAWRMSMEMSYTSVYIRTNNPVASEAGAAASDSAVAPASESADAQA